MAGEDMAAEPQMTDHGSSMTTWLNHHSVLHADWDALAHADAIGIDGTLLQAMLSAVGMSVRRTSADLSLPAVLERQVADGRTVAFVGGAPGVAQRAAARIPGVVLTLNGFDDVRDHARLVGEITRVGASVVVLGLGAPLQDQVAARLVHDLSGVDIYTAGGWLDQLASSEMYFPAWVHKYRLGWAWRIMHEPRRLAYRYTVEPFQALIRLRDIRTRLQRTGFIRDSSGDWFVPRATQTLDDLRPVQVVTQLERAGAQTLSWWLERQLRQSSTTTSTHFLYDKSGSDLFGVERCFAPRRPRTLRELTAVLRRLRNAVRAHGMVIAHTHYAIALTLLMTVTVPKAYRPRIVAVHHWPIERYPFVTRIGYDLGRWRGLIDREVFVSESVRPSADRGVVIQNPIPAVERGDAVADETQTVDVPVELLVVARHSVEKSISTAIEALALMPGRHLTLVGTGPLTQDLRNLAHELGVNERVRFAGVVENRHVRTMMAGASAVVLPSSWEAMPMVLLEALSVGVPIVVSDIDAHAFVYANDAGLAFAVGDPASLADAIEKLDDPRVRARLTAGTDQIREHLSESTCAARWLALLADVAA